jgi:hypothetical protein
MRKRLKYGIPAAVGLGVAGLAAEQGEDPIASLGAGAAGALGGAAGLLASRQLAGKYNPRLMARMEQAMDAPRGGSGQSIRERLENAIRQSPESKKRGRSRTLDTPQSFRNRARTALIEAPASISAAAPAALAAGLVPATAAAAGLGGMAAGQAISAIGNMAGLAIDPEAPGSSNTSNSRVSMQMPAMRMY